MNISNICPKCASPEILKIPGNLGSYGSGNNIILSNTLIMKVVKVTRYLCTNCGFSEEWIDSQEDIVKLKNKFSNTRV